MNVGGLLVLRLPGHSPGSTALGSYWRSSRVNTFGFCASGEMVVGQWQVRGALQVIPGLATAEYPVSPLVLSGLFGTTPENSHMRHPLGPAFGIESGPVKVPWVPCAFWAAPANSHVSLPSPTGDQGSVHILPWFSLELP